MKTVLDMGRLPKDGPPDMSQLALGLAISPDEQLILTGSQDGTARIWNWQAGRIRKSWSAHSAEILTAIFSGDGRRVVTGGMDGTSKIWRTDDGKLIATLMSLLRLIPLTQVRLHVVGASIPSGSHFCVDCLA